MQRSIMIAMMMLLATPAVAELRIPCLWNPFGGCSVTLVSPEYAARPVQPLDPQAARAAVNAFRAENGLKPLALDVRLTGAAAMQSETQAGGSQDRSLWIRRVDAYATRRACRLSRQDCLRKCRLGTKIVQRRVALLEAKFGASDQSAASER